MYIYMCVCNNGGVSIATFDYQRVSPNSDIIVAFTWQKYEKKMLQLGCYNLQ